MENKENNKPTEQYLKNGAIDKQMRANIEQAKRLLAEKRAREAAVAGKSTIKPLNTVPQNTKFKDHKEKK